MGSKGLDHDVYNGDYDKFATEFNLGGPPPPPPTDTIPFDQFVIEQVYPLMVQHWNYQGPRPIKP